VTSQKLQEGQRAKQKSDAGTQPRHDAATFTAQIPKSKIQSRE
jgi:hypothetical protein